MASTLVIGSFLAGSLLSILVPIGLLIVLAVWGTRAIMHVPSDPARTAVHAAGAREAEGRPGAAEGRAGAAEGRPGAGGGDSGREDAGGDGGDATPQSTSS